ncbi:hypothetical protein SAMN05421663_103259 [Terribacillus halophilus]|uniref:Uncharacterized protein n=1 Tax=Terribacillus halophilus TaxID=361279 RepID=A0A1G6NE05_9BACI|nr:hypothetical protein SAMN05421663_103259 [Terribacillus halophilus]
MQIQIISGLLGILFIALAYLVAVKKNYIFLEDIISNVYANKGKDLLIS